MTKVLSIIFYSINAHYILGIFFFLSSQLPDDFKNVNKFIIFSNIYNIFSIGM